MKTCLLIVTMSAGCASAWKTVDETPGAASAPRLIAPLSGQTALSRRPLLRWAASAGAAQVEVCADRACKRRLASVASTTGEARPPADLPPGVVWWRVADRHGGSATWQLVIGPNNLDVANVAGGVTADFDGDGLADLAVGLAAEERVATFRGTPDGLVEAGSIRAPRGAAAFGFAVAPAGDVDGDGYGDLIVGAFRSVDGIGAAFVYRGGPKGLDATPTPLFVDELEPGAFFGWAVSAAGDVDRDGYGDLLVGAPGADGSLGRIFVFRGSPEGVFRKPAYSHSAGDLTDDEAAAFGHAVAGGGDLNGDGFADIVVGAPGSDGGAGRIYVYFGGKTGPRKPLGWLPPENPPVPAEKGAFGWSIAASGDVDGNGAHDLIIGAPEAGLAYLILSRPYADPPGDMIALGAPEPRKRAGTRVTLLGDVDADGLADHAVGGDDGLVVYRGQNAATIVPAAEAPTLLPSGDLDGDGHAELIWATFARGAAPALSIQKHDGTVRKLEMRTPER